MKRFVNPDNIKNFASDYCSYIDDVEIAKLGMINNLATFSDSPDFL
jgi:hypothetical protein